MSIIYFIQHKFSYHKKSLFSENGDFGIRKENLINGFKWTLTLKLNIKC